VTVNGTRRQLGLGAPVSGPCVDHSAPGRLHWTIARSSASFSASTGERLVDRDLVRAPEERPAAVSFHRRHDEARDEVIKTTFGAARAVKAEEAMTTSSKRVQPGWPCLTRAIASA
jgi:hypothetical protein